MRIVAILAVRNERHYIGNSLKHLVESDIEFAVIDNDSDDGTSEIVQQPEFASHLVSCQSLPFGGAFDLRQSLLAKDALANSINCDWIIHLDADEIMHSYRPGETLKSAIERLDAQGWDAINFDEFVFLPVETDYAPDIDGWQPLRYYYFFEPQSPRLVRARKKNLPVTNVDTGGHRLTGGAFKLAPETFALRHYIFRSQQHAFEKYASRIFSGGDIARRWHRNRVRQPVEKFIFPSVDQLAALDAGDDRTLSRDNPRKSHYWEW
jgi:glycosyltransferase involved in cell wall biosynthesis